MAKDAKGNGNIDTKATNRYNGIKYHVPNIPKRLALSTAAGKLQKDVLIIVTASSIMTAFPDYSLR